MPVASNYCDRVPLNIEAKMYHTDSVLVVTSEAHSLPDTNWETDVGINLPTTDLLFVVCCIDDNAIGNATTYSPTSTACLTLPWPATAPPESNLFIIYLQTSKPAPTQIRCFRLTVTLLLPSYVNSVLKLTLSV